jgi:uncharacterized protein Yka (UPF0111/DUF47 family)
MSMKFKTLGKQAAESGQEDSFERQDHAADVESEVQQRGEKMRVPPASVAAFQEPKAPVPEVAVDGILLGHGVGKPSPNAQISYYMKIEAAGQEPQIYWHPNLAQILGSAKIGDTVHAELTGGDWSVSVTEASSVVVDQTVPTSSAFDDLMKLAAGKGDAASVSIDTTAASASTSFSSAAADDGAEGLKSFMEKQAKQAKQVKKATAAAKDPAEAAQQAGAAAPAQAGQAQVASPNVSGVSTGAAAVGALAAAAISAPFMAFASASRSLKQTLGSKKPTPSALPSTPAALMRAMAETLPSITNWKCERIEKAGQEVRQAFDSLVNNDAFQAWAQNVSEVADFHEMTKAQVISELPKSEKFATLREELNGFWAKNTNTVDAYRRACNDFERNIADVRKEYPNSDAGVRDRVLSAMKDVADLTETIPGFGDKVGTYRQSLAERVRLIAEAIQQFIETLVNKTSGQSESTNEMTV